MHRKPLNQTSSDATVSQAEALSEIHENLVIREERRQLFPHAALVGLIAGLIAAVFRTILGNADLLREMLSTWAHQFHLWGWLFPLLFTMAGSMLSIFMVARFAPETSGSGIPHLKAVMHRFRTLRWKRVLPVKFIAGALAIGSGLVLGREGPTVQIGGSVGDAIASWLKVPPREQRTLIAAGAGAGLSAAFNAPLAGVMFVLEEIQRDFHPFVFGAAFLSAAIADIVVRLLSGSYTIFTVPDYPTPPIALLPVFAVLGFLMGAMGVVFNRGLLGAQKFFYRFRSPWKIGIAAVLGATVGLVGWFSPLAIGDGHLVSGSALSGKLLPTAILGLFIVRFLLTITSYGSGAPGGIFSPLLALGALFGLAVGQIAQYFMPAVIQEPAVFAVAGMAAYFTAIVRAPLTGIVLIVEMTGDYQQMLPLLVTCFCAYAVAELMNDMPIYEALLEQDLLRDGTEIKLKEPIVMDFEIEQGAPFAGREVQSLGLPPGCILTLCEEGGRAVVPTAHTRLENYMRITALIAPEASEGIALLRRGCKSKSGQKP